MFSRNLVIRAMLVSYDSLGEKSLFWEGVDWGRNIIGAVRPRNDRSSGRVVQADLVDVVMVLSKGQSILEDFERQVWREV